MSTNFPASVDTYTNPAPTDTLDSLAVPHASQHDNLNDAMTAVQTYALANGLLTGSGVPAGGTGVNTNLYLDTASGIIYRKTAGTWAAIYTPSAAADGTWKPSDQSMTAWNFDPGLAANGSGSPGINLGVMYVHALDTPAATINKIYMICVNSGSAIVNGFAALYNSAGTLLAQSNNQATALNAGTVLVTFTLTSGQVVPAGKVYVGFWCSGGGSPTFTKTANIGGAFSTNANMASPFRFSSVSTGLTTTAPGTLGSPASGFVTNWVGIGT